MKKFEQVYNDIITESSINRIMNYIKNYDCAVISASRNKLINCTSSTLMDKQENEVYTKAENLHRNSLLKISLLKLNYGVTALTGKYAEEGQIFPGRETSYFVVNINDDPDFFNNCFKLSEYFNQDSFLFKAKDTNNAELIGTNFSKEPGYNNRFSVGEFHPDGFDQALFKIGSKIFQFRLNENKQQDRKFIGEKILCEEIFKDLSITTRGMYSQIFKQNFSDLFKK